MQNLNVDGLVFSFPADWVVGKYDDWSFYRNQFGKLWQGIKSLDLLAVSPEKIAWLIEVKDYRQHARTKPSELSAEVAHKVFDTLAAMLPAKLHADDLAEKTLARAVCHATKLRVVLHLEQPHNASKLFTHVVNPANLTQQLRKLLKPIDAHPMVIDQRTMGGLVWQIHYGGSANKSSSSPRDTSVSSY